MTEAPAIPTLARLRAVLAARGVRPARRFGQHFLADPRILNQLVHEADICADDVVVEVGPGPGTLTAALLARGATVVAVEVDERMIGVLHELLGRPERLVVVHEDVLAGPDPLPPGATLALKGQLARRPRGASRGWSLVANLPYSVASTLLVDLFWQAEPPRCAIVTVQREVAERMAAKPGTRAYGPMGALLQLAADVRTLRRLPPGAFWPRPRVESACVRLDPKPLPPDVDPGLLRDVVHAAFQSRRKRLANSLALAFRGRIERATLEELLREKKLDRDTRGELLAPMELAELARDVGGLLHRP